MLRPKNNFGGKKSTSEYPTSFAKNLTLFKSGISQGNFFISLPLKGSSGFYANGWEAWLQTGFPASSLHLLVQLSPKAIKRIDFAFLPFPASVRLSLQISFGFCFLKSRRYSSKWHGVARKGDSDTLPAPHRLLPFPWIPNAPAACFSWSHH